MKSLFICYPKCITCQKAKRWLDSRHIPYEERNIKEQNPTQPELRQWTAQSGLPLKKFFNTSGLVYKALGLSQKLASMSDDEVFAILATDGMLVKRPILITGEKILLGFKESDWEALFSVPGE